MGIYFKIKPIVNNLRTDNVYKVQIFWVYLFSQSGGHASLRSEGQKERRPTRLRLAGWKKDRTLEQDQPKIFEHWKMTTFHKDTFLLKAGKRIEHWNKTKHF